MQKTESRKEVLDRLNELAKMAIMCKVMVVSTYNDTATITCMENSK